MSTTITPNPRPGVPLPAGAVRAEPWEVDDVGCIRHFYGSERVRSAVSISIDGQQDYSGKVLSRDATASARWTRPVLEHLPPT